jgi:flavin reductase (DIM6/NTAB) family NADH-FMN oxidoreductase RutF
MKKEFATCPEAITERWPGELSSFSWKDFVTAIPSPLFVVTGYKSNGKENACLQSWSTFVGDAGEFICIIGSVSKRGHMYQSLKETRCCVLNFPSRDVYDLCTKTIENNQLETDEITASGLTAEKAVSVNAPRIKECFLNIECEFLWEREHFAGSRDVVVALKATHICMDNDHYDESKLGRYGKTGYMYNINSPRNPETGKAEQETFGALELYK